MLKKAGLNLLFILFLAVNSFFSEEKMNFDKSKIEALINSNIIATHAYHVLAVKTLKKKNVAEGCFEAKDLSEADLSKLVDLQKEMLSLPIEDIKSFAAGKNPSFEEKYIKPHLLAVKLDVSNVSIPVNVWAAFFKEKAPQASQIDIKALASLQQMMYDIERDGDVLQNMYFVYNALGLPVYFGQIGIKETSDAEFLAFAKDISKKICSGPFMKDAKTIQMAFRKMYNWGRKYSGERDKLVIAKELLAEPDIKAIVPLLEKLPPQKIAVIGHSYTMNIHWSSPSSFIPISMEVLKIVNPKVEVKQWFQGGLTFSNAYTKTDFYKEVLAFKPDMVFFVLAGSGPEDQKALEDMTKGFTEIGVKKVIVFDRLHTPKTEKDVGKMDISAPRVSVIEVGKLLFNAPDKDDFYALDGIHMKEPYHRLMAKELLKYLAGARKEKLE